MPAPNNVQLPLGIWTLRLRKGGFTKNSNLYIFSKSQRIFAFLNKMVHNQGDATDETSVSFSLTRRTFLCVSVHTVYHSFLNLKKGHGQLFFSMAQQPLVAQDLLIAVASRSYPETPHLVGLLWMTDQPDAETSTWQHNTQKRQTSTPSAVFEPPIPESKWTQTHALDRAAPGIGYEQLRNR
jgi:hypothetical protein